MIFVLNAMVVNAAIMNLNKIHETSCRTISAFQQFIHLPSAVITLSPSNRPPPPQNTTLTSSVNPFTLGPVLQVSLLIVKLGLAPPAPALAPVGRVQVDNLLPERSQVLAASQTRVRLGGFGSALCPGY